MSRANTNTNDFCAWQHTNALFYTLLFKSNLPQILNPISSFLEALQVTGHAAMVSPRPSRWPTSPTLPAPLLALPQGPGRASGPARVSQAKLRERGSDRKSGYLVASLLLVPGPLPFSTARFWRKELPQLRVLCPRPPPSTPWKFPTTMDFSH